MAAAFAVRPSRSASDLGATRPIEWAVVTPGVLKSPGTPHAYALVDGSQALLIDLPQNELLQGLKQMQLTPELLLLTHHHRHTADGAVAARLQQISVRGPRAEQELLTPDGVAKFWQDSVPLRNSRTAYFVLPQGIDGIDASLEDGQTIEWRGWKINVLATPGHSLGHLTYVARRRDDGPATMFCGDALANNSTIWSPFTLDWDHWTDSGAKPAAESLRRMAQLEPSILCPAHAEPIRQDVRSAINRTIAAVEEAGFLKSFERYSDGRLGDAPSYEFLAPDQVATSGEKPWTQLSQHLFITGNTYVLASSNGKTMALDLWGKRSVDQIQKLTSDHGLRMPEVVWVSHAHYDHFDGIYDMPDRAEFSVWTLDRTSNVLEQPGRFRAPFLDARPITVDRKFTADDEVTWHEYSFRVHHLPGQTVFTMGIETTIDGRRCLFTADNFFHMKQFSGSGGWTGLNRALPGGYAWSARKILEIQPAWILAEHGGPFQFNAEDFRRRVLWAEAAAGAADRLSPSGDHRCDWDPHLVAVEPYLVTARPGQSVTVKLITRWSAAGKAPQTYQLEGRGIAQDSSGLLPGGFDAFDAGGQSTTELVVKLNSTAPSGRHVLPVQITAGDQLLGIDCVLVVDVP
jgi:glyoxylase-like metal-dependent hydrolase (beta-lactamase superfamily II)